MRGKPGWKAGKSCWWKGGGERSAGYGASAGSGCGGGRNFWERGVTWGGGIYRKEACNREWERGLL